MSTLTDILSGIKTDLEAIQADDTVTMPDGSSYTFQTDIGDNVVTGIDLRDTELSTYPAASINNVTTSLRDAQALPDLGLTAVFAVECADRMQAGDDWLTIGDRLLSDLQAGIDIAPNTDRARVIVPGGAGRPVYEWLKPKPGSNIVLVRRWYSVEYQEQYRATSPFIG